MRGRASMAVRGLVAVVVLLAGAVAVIAGDAGFLRAEPEVTTVLPAAAGPVRENSAVQFRGVRVGTVAEVSPRADGAVLTLRMSADRLAQIPGDVRVRLLPRTLFGDQYLDLVGGGGGRLAEGVRLAADTSRPAVRLYQVYTRAYELVDALQPAQMQVALSALADALRGRGEQLGRLIDAATALARDSAPMLEHLDEDLHTVAELGADLRAAAPDLARSLDNAVALSDVVIERRRDISALFAGGAGLAERSDRLLAENAERTVQLVRSTDPIADVLAEHPQAFSDTKAGMDAFLDGANRAFATGFFEIRAKLTLEKPYPYGPEDCPRYPGANGPNCASGTGTAGAAGAAGSDAGPIGPVGGPQEQAAMRRLAPLLPARAPDPQLVNLMLGPLVRGTEVVVP